MLKKRSFACTFKLNGDLFDFHQSAKYISESLEIKVLQTEGFKNVITFNIFL